MTVKKREARLEIFRRVCDGKLRLRWLLLSRGPLLSLTPFSTKTWLKHYSLSYFQSRQNKPTLNAYKPELIFFEVKMGRFGPYLGPPRFHAVLGKVRQPFMLINVCFLVLIIIIDVVFRIYWIWICRGLKRWFITGPLAADQPFPPSLVCSRFLTVIYLSNICFF